MLAIRLAHGYDTDRMLPRPHPSVVFQRLEDGAVLFHPETELYFGLNHVGVVVWGLLSPAAKSMDDVCATVAAQYPDIDGSTIRQDIEELMEQLTAEGLVIAPSAPGESGRTA
jgi:hypothetical protein